MHDIVSKVKRSCVRCSTQKYIDRGVDYKSATQAALKELYDYFLREFNALRRTEATSNEVVKDIREKKLLALDAIDVCKACNKDFDRINRLMNERFFQGNRFK